jgi:thioredoxin 2
VAEIVACPNCGTKNRVPASHSGIPECARCHRPLPWIVAAGDSDFDEVAGAASVPVLVDLWAPWCGPCRAVSPAVERTGVELAGKLKVVKVNTDENQGTARRFDVTGIPTLLLLRNGKLVSRQVGAIPASMLKRWVEETIAQAA